MHNNIWKHFFFEIWNYSPVKIRLKVVEIRQMVLSLFIHLVLPYSHSKNPFQSTMGNFRNPCWPPNATYHSSLSSTSELDYLERSVLGLFCVIVVCTPTSERLIIHHGKYDSSVLFCRKSTIKWACCCILKFESIQLSSKVAQHRPSSSCFGCASLLMASFYGGFRQSSHWQRDYIMMRKLCIFIPSPGRLRHDDS